MPLLPVLLLSVPSALCNLGGVAGSSAPCNPSRATGSVGMLSASLVAGLTEERRGAAWPVGEMGQSHLLEGWESASPEMSRLLARVVAMGERYRLTLQA